MQTASVEDHRPLPRAPEQGLPPPAPAPCPLHFAAFDSAVSPGPRPSALYLLSVSPSLRAFFSVFYFSSSLSPLSFPLSQHLSSLLPSLLLPLPIVPPTMRPVVGSISPSLSFLFLAVVRCPQTALPRLWAKPRPCQSFSLRGGPCPGEWASKPAQPGALPTRPQSPHRHRRRVAQKGRQRTQSPGANATGGSRSPPPGPPLPTPHSLSGLRPPP